MTSVADLELRYLHRKLAATGDTPTAYTADSGSTSSLVDAGLTDADDYWNRALLRWDSGPNAGKWASGLDFVAATDTLTLEDILPHAIAAGHGFTLFQGGKHASSQRIEALAASALRNVTGLTVRTAGGLNGEGTGTLRFSIAKSTVTWQPPGEDEGAAVSVAGLALGETAAVYGGGTSDEQVSKFLVLERTADALPAGDAADDVSLDLVPGSFLARVQGADAAAGFTVYRPFALQNTGAVAVNGVGAYCASPAPAAQATTLSVGIGTGTDTLTAASLVNWPVHGWVYNATKDDVRYYYDRSGNTATVFDAEPTGGHRGFSATPWDADDELQPFPWVDIGLDAPGGGSVFEDPAAVTTAPSGVSFSCPLTLGDALSIGSLAAGAVYCVWLRLEIPAGARPVEGGRVDVRVSATYDE